MTYAVLVAACDDRTTSTETTATHAPQLRTAQGPSALVIKQDEQLALILSDEGTGVTLAVRYTLDALAADCANEFFTGEQMNRLQVDRPDGSSHESFKGQKVTLLVFLGTLEDVCAGPPFAVGSGQFIRTDNDVFVSGNRTNAFGFRIGGQVTDAAAGLHKVAAVFHATIDRAGALTIIRNEVTLK
ncbi:MAG: hypothetical protein ACAI18_02740 [Gemmatimonadales bacterium]